MTTCTTHLDGGPLLCIRTDTHTTHVFHASEAPDRHSIADSEVQS